MEKAEALKPSPDQLSIDCERRKEYPSLILISEEPE
jgi:hypothetical protein